MQIFEFFISLERSRCGGSNARQIEPAIGGRKMVKNRRQSCEPCFRSLRERGAARPLLNSTRVAAPGGSWYSEGPLGVSIGRFACDGGRKLASLYGAVSQRCTRPQAHSPTENGTSRSAHCGGPQPGPPQLRWGPPLPQRCPAPLGPVSLSPPPPPGRPGKGTWFFAHFPP